MIDAAALLADSRALVKTLVDDLRALMTTDPATADVVEREYARASVAGRTALGKPEWAEGLHAQVAVAWVLGCVFVRFCEDNRLVSDPLLGGPGHRRAIALDHRSAYLQANPAHDDRHWLREIVARYRALPATGEVFGAHNPIWLLAPSADGARSLVQAFQAVDPDTGEIRHDFTDPRWDTRFLGDLYQDLSGHAKKTYALLQTPEFVEEFILDRTLTPALATFGLRETTLIDPTCGSGHFLLGAFRRLFERWCEAEPGTNPRELARRALDAIGGVDLNPFAVAIARFRLLIAALRAGGDGRLADAPAYPIQIAVGDSLLHGDPPGRLVGILAGDEVTAASTHGYATEDIEEARALLSRGWHVVVGNPPYITVRDPAMNALYRLRFEACRGKYSLGVPFTERFFQQARDDGDPARAGFVGMITAASFMKREFGKKLIEQWAPAHDLTHVIDTSGAYIPGHGIPTVILLGRNRMPVGRTVRTVMGIRGEPAKPADPERGLVWSSIVHQVDAPGSRSEFLSVADLSRSRLHKHPWSIGGGGAAELKELLDSRAAEALTEMVESIGFHAISGEDELFLGHDAQTARRWGLAPAQFRPLCGGENVRDWGCHSGSMALFPYDRALQPVDLPRVTWPFSRYLETGLMFGKTRWERGLSSSEFAFLSRERDRKPLLIVFASVATHNHFVLDRGGKVFKQSSPVITLPGEKNELRHLPVIGVLNSSTACFWMKQVFHGKGNGGVNEGYRGAEWEEFFDHDGTKLRRFPIPPGLDSATAMLLDRFASDIAATTAPSTSDGGVPTPDWIAHGKKRYSELRAQMIAAQERFLGDLPPLRPHRLRADHRRRAGAAAPTRRTRLRNRSGPAHGSWRGRDNMVRPPRLLADYRGSLPLVGVVPAFGGAPNRADRDRPEHRAHRTPRAQAAVGGQTVGRAGEDRSPDVAPRPA